ncbi:hypothetical protein C0991_005462 [Blastosporella zonata]|nr:hypothetical protein C0991_005462 [Blastosporella zonata]
MQYRTPSSSFVSSDIRRRSSSLIKASSTGQDGIVRSNSLTTIDDCYILGNESTVFLLPSGVVLQETEYPPVPSAPHTSYTLEDTLTCVRFSSTPPTNLLPTTAVIPRPRNIHTKSEQSFRSICSGISVDSGHRSLIPSVGTTAKFTNKWPTPAPLRKINLRGGDLNDAMDLELSQAIVAAIESGEPLGEDEHQWTQPKWCLFLSVLTVFAYGSVGLVCAIKTWFRGWDEADVLRVVDNDILVLITLTASMMLLTSLVGICGVFLNSRPILALYTLLLWPDLMALAAIGYTSYHRVTYALDHKLNLSWSRYLTPLGRLLVQDALHCCGYSSPLHGATLSSRCYLRSPLPGCKAALMHFERRNLATIWSAAFSILVLHLLNIVAALLSANHLTETFGKGITPKNYRLTAQHVKDDAETILAGLQKGGDFHPSSAPT